MKKNFKNFKELLKIRFSAIFFKNMVRIARGITELELYFKGGGMCLFEKESFGCKTRQNLSINCDARNNK